MAIVVTTALIDGDIIAYKAALGATTSYDWGDDTEGQTSTVCDTARAIKTGLELVEEWREGAACNTVIVAFTGAHKFRRYLLPSYNAHRKGSHKPEAYHAVKDAITAKYRTHLIEGLEADDVMGILATSPRHKGSVVVTLDKDLTTVPSMHFNPDKMDQPARITEAEADWHWMFQTLTGDGTDGYTGLPKCGPVGARKILKPPHIESPAAVLWPRVVAAYRAKGLTEDHAITQARMARILRREDYDSHTKEIILWHPKESTRLNLETVCAALTQPMARAD